MGECGWDREKREEESRERQYLVLLREKNKKHPNAAHLSQIINWFFKELAIFSKADFLMYIYVMR